MSRECVLNASQASDLQREFGTPTFVYDQKELERRCRAALAFPNPYGLTARYAMKACPNGALLKIFNGLGLHIDASSGFEVRRALSAGVPGNQIQLTAQQLPDDLEELLQKGVIFNACSLNQLREFGRLSNGGRLSIRINPGLGSGHSNRTNVGGPSSSFGIWHEYLDHALEIAAQYRLTVDRLHSHIGSGTDPSVWQHCARLTLAIAARLPDVISVNLGGGYKVARMPDEEATDLDTAGQQIVKEFEHFYESHGRKLALEIEPGTFFVANAGALVCTVIDVVDTGSSGYHFIKIDAGMTEVMRPSMYGAQHPIHVFPRASKPSAENVDYIVAGHCCESGDVLTPEPDNPEGLLPRRLLPTQTGDILVIGATGAYCAGMSAKNYNSFPEAAEVLVANDGTFHLIRQRQTLEQVTANEKTPDFLQ
jgi:diaminopimelate decarboxylase